MSFKNIGLSAELLRAIQEKGYNEPTPIQSEVIPPILKGRDIMAAAQTGTGKTAGFTLPLLESLLQSSDKSTRGQRIIRALILTPTRELAAQVDESVRLYGKYLSFKSAVVYGGVKIGPQISRLRQGVDILVATPGRLLDLVNQRAVNLSSVKMFVLDEADRMLDMGFIPDIRTVMELIPKERQTLLFSATFSQEIKSLAKGLLSSPVAIEIAGTNTTAENVKQIAYFVDQKKKPSLLSFLIGSNNWKQVLVFTRTKYGADRLAKELDDSGLRSTTIHGNKTQAARTKALADFKQGKVRVLVATDIAARGLDIQKLPHVVNFDLPQTAEDYVHRIGRTGRAKNEGEAISLVSADDRYMLRDIERLLKCKIFQDVVPGFEPDPSAKAEKKSAGRGAPQKRHHEGRQRSFQKTEKSERRNERGHFSKNEPKKRREFSAMAEEPRRASTNKREREDSSFKKTDRSERREDRGYFSKSEPKKRGGFSAMTEEPRRASSNKREREDFSFSAEPRRASKNQHESKPYFGSESRKPKAKRDEGRASFGDGTRKPLKEKNQRGSSSFSERREYAERETTFTRDRNNSSKPARKTEHGHHNESRFANKKARPATSKRG